MTEIIAEYSIKMEEGYWVGGRIERGDDLYPCEDCQRFTSMYAATWTQGEVGSASTLPDTMVIIECLTCFFKSDSPIIFGDQHWRAGVVAMERGGQ